MYMSWFIVIFISFCVGGIMFSSIIPKAFIKKDITSLSDDLNPGAYNAFKYSGKRIGTVCLLLDFFKGFIPVFLVILFMDYKNVLFFLVMIAPVLGHSFGIFNHFHGGKCITTSFGVLAAIAKINFWPLIFLASLYVFFSLIIKIESNKAKSIIVYSSLIFFVISMLANNFNYYAIGVIAISIIVIIKHMNLKKILNNKLLKIND